MPEPAEPAPQPLLAPLLAAAYLACVAGAGALANCSLLASLKSSTTGIFFILLQLAIADIVIGASIGSEIWSFNTRNWMFGNGCCIAYRGLSVLASTASSYLVATIALHTLATVNLEEKSLTKRLKRMNPDEEEEIRSSRHSLVASSDTSTPPRTMNVDYRVSAARVSITQPTLFVWIMALSLSVPDFALAATVQPNQNVVLCTIVDTSQRLHLYSTLALLNLCLPMLIMFAAGALVTIKLNSKKLMCQINRCESKAALKLSLSLIAVYFVLCVPRSAFMGYNIYATSMKGNETSLIESAHFDNSTNLLSLTLSCIFMSSILVRPLLCIVLLPSVRKAFCYGNRDTDTV